MIKKIIFCLMILIITVSVDARPRHRHKDRKLSDLEKAAVIVDMTVGTLATLSAISNSNNNCQNNYIAPRPAYTNGNVYIPPPIPVQPVVTPRKVTETIIKVRGRRTIVTEEEYEKVTVIRTYE